LASIEEPHETAVTAPPIFAERVISKPLHFLINSLLRNVIKSGTGRRALSLGRNDLAGKTGTTTEHRDAWFNGFSPSIVAVAWVGFDNSKPLGNKETGGRAALPMWIDFMREALKNKPAQNLSQPNGITSILIDPTTGLKSEASNPEAIFEFFREENIPKSNPNGKSSYNNQITDKQQEIEEGLF
jgi:penicillin-binding protein 1A